MKRVLGLTAFIPPILIQLRQDDLRQTVAWIPVVGWSQRTDVIRSEGS